MRQNPRNDRGAPVERSVTARLLWRGRTNDGKAGRTDGKRVWGVVRAEPDNPFVIGDAPVVTWERTDQNMLIYGLGFSRPNVEVILPVSPTECLHVLPAVGRTRQPTVPSTQDVNIAQASFATHHCFTNIRSDSLDAALQPNFGRVRLGINAFSIRHRDYSNSMFDLLMNRGKWVDPPVKQ